MSRRYGYRGPYDQRGAGSGGVAPPSDQETVDTYTFAVPDGTLLRNYSGWAVYNSVGSTTGQDTANINSGAMRITSGDSTGLGNILFGHDQAGATLGQMIEWDYVSGNGCVMAVAALDEQNGIFLQMANTSSWQFYKRIAGVNTSLGFVNSSYSALTAGERMRMYYINGTASLHRIRTNGTVDVIFNRVATGLSAPPGTRAGRTSFSQSQVIDNVTVTSLHGEMLLNTPSVFRPSRFNNLGKVIGDYTGVVDYPIAGSYMNAGAGVITPANAQYQLRDVVTGALVQDWADCTTFAPSAGAFTGTIAVPVTTNPCQVRIRDRANISVIGMVNAIVVINSTATSNTPTTVACGPCGIYYGQSNAGFTITGGTADPTNLGAYASLKVYIWNDRIDQTGQTLRWNGQQNINNGYCAVVLTKLMSDYFGGVTCGMAGGGIGSQPVTALKKGAAQTWNNSYGANDNGYNIMGKQAALTGTAAGWLGRCAWMIYDQGEAEGDVTGSNINEATYAADVAQLFADFRADYFGARNITVISTAPGRGTAAPAANTDNNWGAARRAHATACATAGEAVWMHRLGLTMSDSLHEDNPGRVWKQQRIAMAIRRHWTGAGAKGRGIQIDAANISRAGAVIDAPLLLNGATGVDAYSAQNQTTAGNAAVLDGLEVSLTQFGAALPMTSMVLTTTAGLEKIRFTLASDPGASVYIRAKNDKNMAITSYPMGNYSGEPATRIPMEPPWTPLLAA